MADIEVQIDFTDITLCETDGNFTEVNKIMSQYHSDDKWAIRSNVSIVSPSGLGEMVIQCSGNKEIYILEYKPSISDVFYNYDIQAISEWAQNKGWNVPQPKWDLIEENKLFWKHFWDTTVIDSDYFDKRYGKREY